VALYSYTVCVTPFNIQSAQLGAHN